MLSPLSTPLYWFQTALLKKQWSAKSRSAKLSWCPCFFEINVIYVPKHLWTSKVEGYSNVKAHTKWNDSDLNFNVNAFSPLGKKEKENISEVLKNTLFLVDPSSLVLLIWVKYCTTRSSQVIPCLALNLEAYICQYLKLALPGL